jgi:hypothetical protein
VTLVERLEALTGPDREVDAEIFEIHHKRKRNISTFEQYEPSEKLPAYTSSLDAALSLGRTEEERLLILVAVVQAAKAGKPEVQWYAAGCAEALHLRGVK